jgi:hypothetical protein
MIRRELMILIGDADGADRAIQDYFARQKYNNIEIYCTAGECRNNVGDWRVCSVRAPHTRRDFAYFSAKDAAMADAADTALMLWDENSHGTIVNVARLVARAKPTVIYRTPAKTFHTMKTRADLSAFLSAADSIVRAKLEEYIRKHVAEFGQVEMF